MLLWTNEPLIPAAVTYKPHKCDFTPGSGKKVRVVAIGCSLEVQGGLDVDRRRSEVVFDADPNGSGTPIAAIGVEYSAPTGTVRILGEDHWRGAAGRWSVVAPTTPEYLRTLQRWLC
jgi:hypothetical protein